MSDVTPGLEHSWSFPSAVFPAPPSFHFSAPTEWVADPRTGTDAAVRLDSGPDAFAPNVLISSARIAGSRDTILAAQSASVSSLEGVEVLDEIDLDVAGIGWHLWEYAFTDPRVGTGVQLAAIALTGAAPVIHTVSVAASVTADRAPEVLPTIRAILQSISINERQVQS